MKRILTALAFGLATAAPAVAEGPVVTSYDGTFDDATFAVESAIVGQGLVIDYVSHVGDMLNRTAADVGSDVQLFENAQIFVFCSAVVSRQVMEDDPMNLAHCPYGIFVSEGSDGVQVGYRDYPDGSMQAVEDLLAGIVAEAVGD